GEGLHTETDAIDSVFDQHRKFLPIEAGGIGLDREFTGVGHVEPAANERQKLRELRSAEGRRRAATDEERLDAARAVQRRELDFERAQIAFDEIVLARDEREVAVPAAMRAERNVNVRGRRFVRSTRHATILLEALPK